MNNEWHSVNESLPPIGLMVWVTDTKGRLAFAEIGYRTNGVLKNRELVWTMCDWEFFYKEDGLIDTDYLYKDIKPTHWQFLPKPLNTKI